MISKSDVDLTMSRPDLSGLKILNVIVGGETKAAGWLVIIPGSFTSGKITVQLMNQ